MATRQHTMPRLRLEIRHASGKKRVLTKHEAIEKVVMQLRKKRQIFTPDRSGRPKGIRVERERNGRSHVVTYSDSPASGQNAAAAEYVRSLKEAEGGACSSQEFCELAGISRQALQERREAFSIVYWTDAKGHCHYPKWQFDLNVQVLPEVREIVEILHTHDTLQVLTTFLVPSIGEPGISPLHLIQSGQGQKAVEHVRAIANEH